MQTNGTLSWSQRCDRAEFRNVLKQMNECSMIKYSGYRTAAKFRVLQKSLHTDSVRLSTIAGVFSRHHLQVTENAVLLKYCELEDAIFDIFFAAQKENANTIDVDLCTELMITFLHKIYDRKNNGVIEVLDVKVILALLSSAQLQEKYQYMFMQLADHNDCVSANKMEKLFNCLTHITVYLNESSAFGFEQIPATLESCFQQAQGTFGLTEDMFIGWMMHEPQLLSWLPTLHRMQMAELVNHEVKCTSCKIYPIIGLRYRCLECFRYNLCQICFFTGKTSKKHKLQHPVQEYFQESSHENTFAFFKMLKNKLCGNSSQLQYLSVQPNDKIFDTDGSQEDIALIPPCGSHSSTPTVIHDTMEIQPQMELQNVISRLEEETRQLQQTINKLREREETSDMYRQLRDHQILLQSQVERLKKVKRSLWRNITKNGCQSFHMQSTPLHRTTETLSLINISPIFKESDVTMTEGLQELQRLAWQLKRDKMSEESVRCEANGNTTSLSSMSSRDLSSWVVDRVPRRVPDPSGFSTWVQDPSSKQKLEDLDTILAKLEDLMASNLSQEESISNRDNAQFQQGIHEMEELLGNLIEQIENQKI